MYDNIISNEKIKKKIGCHNWNDLEDKRVVDIFATYPNIFSDSPNLTYPNYNDEKSCDCIDTNNVLPTNHTNKIK